MPRLPRTIALGPLRLPAVVAGLILATVAVSVLGAVAARSGAPALRMAGVLAPAEVWRGQVWRLFTWVLIELDPVSLIFGCLTLYWLGRDLVTTWGTRRFVVWYFGLAAAAGTVVALVTLFWSTVSIVSVAGSWPVLVGLIVAWGMLHPDREIRLYGVVKLSGRWIVRLTLGGTVLFALFYGAAPFVTHFAAELLVLVRFGPVRRIVATRRKQRQAAAQSWTFDKWMERERHK